MQDELTSYADPNDRASQESDMALELRNRDRERKLIKKIDETLRNIESQDYGYCTGCGEEIGLKRLEARPTATLCIDCKTLDEIREKQMAGDAGMMVGPVLLGFISDAFSYRTAIGVSAAVFSLAIIVALKIPETNSAHLGDSRKPPINEV